MSEIMFYHAIETDMRTVLYQLLQKSLAQSKRSLIYVVDLEAAQKLSDFLWAHRKDYIMPHGLVCETLPEHQPILITYRTENLNKADYIFFIGAVNIEIFDQFHRIIALFDDTDDGIKNHFRSEYKRLKNQDNSLKYYQQQNGKWVCL